MHIFEYAKSGRSSCKGPKKTCPVTDRSIRQGELRLGVEVETPRSLLFWRHWCCTTPKVIENLHAAYSEPSEIQGWDTLREDDQERIQRAWDLGRIPENELPQPAEEHIDPREKKKGKANLPATNEAAAEREKDSGKKTKATKKAVEKAESKKKAEPAKKQTNTKKKGDKQAAVKEEESKETVEVKDEESADPKIEGGDKKQETVIKKPKKPVEEPKVASYASRKASANSQSAPKEPTRKSARVAALNKDEPSPKRKISSSESKNKKAKAA